MCGRVRIRLKIAEMAEALGLANRGGSYEGSRRSTGSKGKGCTRDSRQNGGDKVGRDGVVEKAEVIIKEDEAVDDLKKDNLKDGDSKATCEGAHTILCRQLEESEALFEGVENAQPGAKLPVFFKKIGDTGTGTAGEELEVSLMHFGLIPKYFNRSDYTASSSHFDMFNARSESLTEKVSFKNLLANNRCIVVIDGYYEWKEVGCGVSKFKQPYYCHIPNRPMFIAALYDRTRWGIGDADISSFAMLTCDACDQLRELHSRKPVVLTLEEAHLWLGLKATEGNLIDEGTCSGTCSGDTCTDSSVVSRLIKSAHDFSKNQFSFEYYSVTRKMSDIQYQEGDCSKRLAQASLTSFFNVNKSHKDGSKEAKVNSGSLSSSYNSSSSSSSSRSSSNSCNSSNVSAGTSSRQISGSKRAIELVDLTEDT